MKAESRAASKALIVAATQVFGKAETEAGMKADGEPELHTESKAIIKADLDAAFLGGCHGLTAAAFKAERETAWETTHRIATNA